MSVRAGVAAHDVAVAVEEYATVGRSINTSSAATTAKVKAMAAAKVMADDATKTVDVASCRGTRSFVCLVS